MELIVKFENNFGVNRIVPICERGKLLAQLMGNKTFGEKNDNYENPNVIILKKLGYVLKTQAETL